MMTNEILLMVSIVILYGTVVLLYKFFGRDALFMWMATATILANIEVLRVVEAFGIEQTLGNVLFASTFLTTQILNENESEESAKKCAWLGIIAAIAFAVISQSWLFFRPSASDWAGEAFDTLFSITPRLILVSALVYGICQHLDIRLYRLIWTITKRRSGDGERLLWLRNNAATLISQAVNTVLYNLGAFWGIYSAETLLSICIACYLIFIVTSLCDTPALYMARMIRKKNRTE